MVPEVGINFEQKVKENQKKQRSEWIVKYKKGIFGYGRLSMYVIWRPLDPESTCQI